MARLEPYTDDFIAKALKDDARERSAKYSSLGLQAFMPNRQRGPAAKPNTRFLQNILRDTDNHNAALLAKERREARERQKQLSKQTDGASDSPRTGRAKDENRRNEDKRRKRRREEYEEDLQRGDRKYGRLSRSTSPSPSSRNRRENKDAREAKRGHRRKYEDEKHRDRDTRHRSRRKRDSRSLSPNPGSTTNRGLADRYYPRKEVDEYRPGHRNDNAKPRSPCSSRSPSPPPKQHRVETGTNNTNIAPQDSSHSRTSSKKRHSTLSQRPRDRSNDQNDSDPLEDLVGPLPPPQGPKPRGRGAAKSASNIDEHFASTYDPSADLSPGSEGDGDDWENAMEAFRDRQKWKQMGANRLREAGFSEDEVKKWENRENENGRGGDERDVKWTGKGERREWDRGKVLDHVNGTVRLEPEWGRLKGT